MDGSYGCFASCEEVLAPMGKFISNGFSSRTRCEVPRLLSTSSRLRRYAGSGIISPAAAVDDRYVQPPTPACDERQRSTLEKLIANVAPDNARNLSAALIKEFVSLGRVFAETRESLQRVIGPSHEVIALLEATQDAITVGLRAEVEMTEIQATDQNVIDYLVSSMGSLNVEQLRVLFLDRSNRLISDEVLASGTLTTLTAYPRSIFKRAFELSASAIILVHNHPGGQIEPSDCDIHFTKKLTNFGRQLEVEVKDHIIIAGARWFSFLRRGMI